MIEIKRKYNTAKMFIDSVENSAKEQIQTLCEQSFTENCKSETTFYCLK